MLATLAPAAPGRWSHGPTRVTRANARHHLPPGTLHAHHMVDGVRVWHSLRPSDLSDDLAGRVMTELAPRTADEFEAIVVGLVRSTIDDPLHAWATYYRNSLARLVDGTAAFAPVHARAQQLCVGGSVLELGSCFGFFALRAARAGFAVTATDICPGTVGLLTRVAAELGVPLDAQVHDAARVTLPGEHSDTVVALHLLEHLDEPTGARVLTEAVRLARKRVVVAVPFEDQATACHRHIRTFDLAALDALGTRTGLPYSVFEHHGGWLVLDNA
ncbi:mycofactocin oligosaccharide methyltransferase MftM [Tsukamurella soli]|uniref:Mycofactocin oligosaccharide methyltransferase MftM n=1 Tax=Tsukamurella soli TaxID=644556 RepID=A0ABP8JA33_9ACTN